MSPHSTDGQPPERLCACGCGASINPRYRFLRGHNARLQRLPSPVCRRCGRDHGGDLSAFVRDRSRWHGRADRCTSCAREAARQTVDANRAIIVAFKSRPCMDCGIRYPHYVMDCDHREGERKTWAVGSSALVSTARLLAELPKCDVVCANCHRLRTHLRGGGRS